MVRTIVALQRGVIEKLNDDDTPVARRDAAMRRSRHAKAGMGDGYLRLTDQAVEIACCDPRRERSHVTVLVP